MPIYYEAKALERAIDAAPRITPSTKSVLKKIIRSAPVAGAAPVVHGCWIEKPFLMGISRFCSKCGDNFGMPHGVYRYCPTCGAKMDLEAGG